MNDTKWRKVIRVLVAEKIRPRIKLIYDESRDSRDSFGPVIRGGLGPDNLKRPEYITQVTPKWCDSGSGPFKMEEIDWLAITRSEFDQIQGRLPPNLKLVELENEIVIVGYEY